MGYDGEKYKFVPLPQSDGVAQSSLYNMQCTVLSQSQRVLASY